METLSFCPQDRTGSLSMKLVDIPLCIDTNQNYMASDLFLEMILEILQKR